MEFCPKCGSLMMPQRKDDKVVLTCPSCGFEKTVENVSALRGLYTVKKKIVHKPSEKTIVIGEKEEEALKVGVKVTALCPKCGYREAYYWEMQTRSADEPTTRFFKCVKCGYVWREYD